MDVSLWQLADDPQTYGPIAGHFILTTPDGEQEISAHVFETAGAAQRYAFEHDWQVVKLQTEREERELANLLNRAAAAIETPDDLSPVDVLALIDDLTIEAKERDHD